MKMVILNMKEQYEFEIIKKVKYGKLSNNLAQIKLDKCTFLEELMC